MNRILFSLPLILMLLLPACGKQKEFSEIDPQEQSGHETPSFEEQEFSFAETTFYYQNHGYDVTSRVSSINSILSAVQVGEKIAVECHVGPQNGVYCIFDTGNKAFERDIFGNHLTWYQDDITTAVYSFWSDIYFYDGEIMKSYDLAEGEFIYDLSFSKGNTQLIVTIMHNDGTEELDRIDL